MKRFDTDKLMEGDILCGRNMVSKDGAMIRAILGSTSNHNALIIRDKSRQWVVGDMFPPVGVMMDLSHYEDIVAAGEYDLRVVRIKDATQHDRRLMSFFWWINVKGVGYSTFSLYRLWVMRIVNSLPWTIHGTWCTRAIGIVCGSVFPPERNIFRKIYKSGTPLKLNETPRTIENRLVQGLLEDVTDQVLVDI